MAKPRKRKPAAKPKAKPKSKGKAPAKPKSPAKSKSAAKQTGKGKAKRSSSAPAGAARKRGTGTRGTRKKGGQPPQRVQVSYSEPWMEKFIDHLREGGTVSVACQLAVVGRSTAYRHRQKDEAFALAWADAEEESTETLEAEAYRRAVKGVEKPVHYEGRRIDFVTEYSDTLLIFLLKARKPETYRDRIDHRHSGGISRPAPGVESLDLSKLKQSEIDTLERLHEKAATTEEA